MDEIRGYLITIIGTLVVGIVIGGMVSLWGERARSGADCQAPATIQPSQEIDSDPH